MKLKKLSLLIVVIALVFMVSGCSTKEEKPSTNNGSGTKQQTIVEDDFNDAGSGKLKCSQEVDAEEGLEVEIKYYVDYRRGNILKLRSISKVTGSNNEKLDVYEEAYKGVASHYKGLEHYITKVIRDSNSVTYDTTINYDKIDTKKLLEIEGEEDNIVVRGKAKLSLWLDLAGKVGITCEEV